MSDSVRPHRQQPTGLPHPWDSPGKNTGVGFRFLLQCMEVKSESEVAQSRPTLSDPMDCRPIRLLRPWDFPGKSTRVDCHCLLRYSLDILLLLFGNNVLICVQFKLLLPDLPTGFSRGRSGGLVLSSLSEFSTFL